MTVFLSLLGTYGLAVTALALGLCRAAARGDRRPLPVSPRVMPQAPDWVFGFAESAVEVAPERSSPVHTPRLHSPSARHR
jgi:hypothetical protein